MAAELVYATLLLSDSYLAGALVLAHSLRDAGATKKLAVLVTLDSVSANAITQLQTVYDHVLPVPRIRNERPANLYLMDRPDLHSAFTKINLWKQTQFSRIVYLDADVVAYRAPDELFSLPHAFSAAPDIGWPDLFNTGVMVLTPNMADFYALLAMADKGISFDGADQGLLNMHFGRAFNRLSFAYNVTPSSHYQYIPAYRHFASSISMVHFIGPDKPWLAGRNAPRGNSPHDDMVGRWWAVHDRHYRQLEASLPPAHQVPSQLVQDAPEGESQSSSGERRSRQDCRISPGAAPGKQASRRSACEHDHRAVPAASPGTTSRLASFSNPARASSATIGEAPAEQRPIETWGSQAPPAESKDEPLALSTNTWDAQRQPPPPDSKPEAINFPSTHYEMSRDTNPFVPPARYPSPPRDMWYEVPGEPPAPSATSPRPIFPWERSQPKPSRSFSPEALAVADDGADEPAGEQPERGGGPRALAEHYGAASPEAETSREPQTPTTPAIKVVLSDPWTSFPRVNAWDDVPEIGRYVESLQRYRRMKGQGAAGGPGDGGGLGPTASGHVGCHGSVRLTDFPSEAERPSLPVTPAPIRRCWDGDATGPGSGGGRGEPLPAAEGVPPQAEWDPAVQLQELAKQQSEALLRKLGGGGPKVGGKDGDGASREIPSRPLPFRSETAESPTDVARRVPPSVLSPQPIRREASAAGLVRGLGMLDETTPPPASEPLAAGESGSGGRGRG